jgi:hypothetical protein
MSEKRNSASRLAKVLSKALQQPENIATVDIWLRALGKPAPELVHEKYFFVTDWLQLMLSQLENVREHLRTNGISATTYEPCFDKIEYVISPSVLGVGWAGVKPQLSSEVMLALNFCKDMMPEDEVEISTDELESLAQDLDGLEEMLHASDLPQHLKAVIKRYVNSIWQALDEYPIAGARSLKSANSRIVGELIDVQVDIQESNEKPIIKKLAEVLKKVNNAADAVIKADNMLQIGHKTISFLQQLF